MRKLTLLITGLLLFEINYLKAQVAPFSLPPKWYFGHQAGMNFAGGAPVLMTGNTWDGSNYSNQEGATTECLPNTNVLYYSNTCRLANGSNANFGPTILNGGGNSSTQGGLSIPNPANASTQFYMVTTDVDPSGGSDCTPNPNRGVWAYPINSALTIGTPIQLSAADMVQEVIAASSDNADGYWIISHGGLVPAAALSTYYAWHVSNNGTINTAPVTSTGTFAALEYKDQGGLKVNKCNTRVAYVNANHLEVMNWNPSTGAIGPSISSFTAPSNNWFYGVEFSPDGNILYVTDFQAGLYHYNIATGAYTQIASDGASSSPGYGNMHIGPDDKIYVSQKYGPGESGPKYLGVINNPNSTTSGGANYVQTGAGSFTLSGTSANYPSTAAGLITLGWHNPFLTISNTSPSPCTKYSYTYKQYYGTSIPVIANSEQWDFGDGGGWQSAGSSPNHNYSANNTYTVKLRVKDQLCQNYYTTQKTVSISCVLPVELSSFTVEKSGIASSLKWTTQTETNNRYFQIERSSDGMNYLPIGKIPGHGNSSSPINYSYRDPAPSIGVNYYRLVQQDVDGHTEISNTVTVNFEDSSIFVYPNPTLTGFKLKITGHEHAYIVVTDVPGREIFKREVILSEQEYMFGEDLSPNHYIIQIFTDNEIKTFKVAKQ